MARANPFKKMFLFAFISAVPMELTLLCVIIFGAGGHQHLLYDPPPKADEAGCSVANPHSGFNVQSGQSASGTIDLVTCGFIRRSLSAPQPPEGVPAARMIATPTRKLFPFKTLNAFALKSRQENRF